MDIRELAKTDLNLLIALQVLLEERNVSRAAEKLFITQPAMSKTLSRLRSVFDDDLFTRSSHGMQPTPRALALSTSLNRILGDVSNLLSPTDFDPREFSGEVTVALSEYIGAALLPGLMTRLNAQAPQLSLRVITRVENQLEELALGNLDFAIHIKQSHYGPDYRVEALASSPPAILVREGHPLAQGEVTLQRLSTFPVIRLYISDWEQMEIRHNEAIMSLADHQRGSLETSHLLTALEVLRVTDFFMPGPAYILQNKEATTGIAGLPAPYESISAIDYALVCHRRTQNSALHNWLWDEITCTIRDMRALATHKVRQRFTAGATTT